MTMNRLFIIVCIVFVSCGEPVFMGQDVDPALGSLFMTFQTDAAKYNHLEELDIPYMIMLGNLGDQAAISNPARNLIIIDSAYVDHPYVLKYVLYHECGHYFYNLEHNTSFIMMEEADSLTIDEFVSNEDEYIREFFSTIR